MEQLESYISYNKRHVYFLVFTFLITNHFFNLFIVDIHIWRILNWAYSSWLACYVLSCYLFRKIETYLVYKWAIILVFLSIVVCSFFYLSLCTNQTFSETFRVSISWFQLLLVFYLVYKEYSQKEIFDALKIFSFIWFTAWILGFISPFPLYDASGEFDANRLSNAGRGILRLNISGNCLMHLWGLWCLSIYTTTFKKKYLVGYLLCLLFVLLCISRQHILYYSTIGFLFLMYKIPNIKKIFLLLGLYITIAFVIPQTTIYQKTEQLTKAQMKANGGGKNDVRIKAATYYFTEFPQDFYTVLMGHGADHAHSEYGKKVKSIILSHGYVMADVGYASIYIKYGMLGLLCFGILLIQVLRSKTINTNYGIKLFFVYTYLGNIFSHNIDLSMIGLALGLYVLLLDEYKITNELNNGV